jgi:phosphate transport system substrate-binding protein
MKRLVLLAAALALVSNFAWADLRYNGSSTIGENFLPETVAMFTSATGIKFSPIQNAGSGKGFKALLAGECDVAGMSRAPKDAEKKEAVRFYTVGYDAISVIVHRDNPVKALSKDQIAGIFSGKIRNWKDVGGNDAAIVPVTEILGEKRATQVVFTKIVLGTKDLMNAYGDNVVQVDKPADEAAKVAADVNAISAVSAAFVTPDHHALTVDGVAATKANVVNGSYPISRPLNLVTPRRASKDVMQFVKFMLKPEAQAVVGKKFVPAK